MRHSPRFLLHPPPHCPTVSHQTLGTPEVTNQIEQQCHMTKQCQLKLFTNRMTTDHTHHSAKATPTFPSLIRSCGSKCLNQPKNIAPIHSVQVRAKVTIINTDRGSTRPVRSKVNKGKGQNKGKGDMRGQRSSYLVVLWRRTV